MQQYQELSDNLIKMIAKCTHNVDLLFFTPCPYTRNMLLYELKKTLSDMDSLIEILNTEQRVNGQSATGVSSDQGGLRTFTREELAQFDGRNGKPAYVAVNGTVYDVTNSAAWAAATHFGLSAGKDLTEQFSSCHRGQPILSNLQVVGKLI